VVRAGVGAGGEMTQALYAHMNNKKKINLRASFFRGFIFYSIIRKGIKRGLSKFNCRQKAMREGLLFILNIFIMNNVIKHFGM
jgi:hypothetical protein